METGFFDGQMLIMISGLGSDHVDHGTDLTALGKLVVFQIRSAGAGGVSGRKLDQLPDLLVERHLLKQGFDAIIDLLGRQLRIGGWLSLRDGNKRAEDRKCDRKNQSGRKTEQGASHDF